MEREQWLKIVEELCTNCKVCGVNNKTKYCKANRIIRSYINGTGSYGLKEVEKLYIKKGWCKQYVAK